MQSKNKVIIASAIGTFVEWAEFSFYGYLAFKFAHLFFPEDTPYAMLFSLCIFAASYLARPFGSIVFGIIGDKFGRKQALSLSLVLMGVATLSIGLLPSYESIGVAAPLLLLFLRILQGISVSGEFTGAAIFVAEHYHGGLKSLAVSWVSFAAALGMMLGAAMASIVSLSMMPEWFWRVPFYLGFVGCLIGLYFRISTTESPEFESIRVNKAFFNGIKAFKGYTNQLMQCFFIAAFVGVYIYICNLWWVSFVIQRGVLTSENAHWVATFGVATVTVLTPIAALLADRLGTQKMLKAGLLSSVITVPALFYLSGFSNIYLALCAQALYALSNTLVTGSMFRYLVDIFPVNIRYTGMGVAWSISVATFGGTAPLVAQFLAIDLANIAYVVIYVCIIALVAFFSVVKSSIIIKLKF
ncbi:MULTISPECIES: MFS transporter [Cysteiniphilum]|uniref:MFS transporter n=1 Tax=Cysteiniphilum TaxID=2056696 RepID=UPI00178671CF|nr:MULTISPECIES: MFS transporter [Cysteiniphilum]